MPANPVISATATNAANVVTKSRHSAFDEDLTPAARFTAMARRMPRTEFGTATVNHRRQKVGVLHHESFTLRARPFDTFCDFLFL